MEKKKMENLYEISKNSGKFLYELARADLAYLTTIIALPVTMSLDLITKSKFRRSITLCEGALKFAEGKK